MDLPLEKPFLSSIKSTIKLIYLLAILKIKNDINSRLYYIKPIYIYFMNIIYIASYKSYIYFLFKIMHKYRW